MSFWQLLLVVISVLGVCQAGPNDTALTPFIEKSARLARISAAIAIQNGIYDPKSIIADVIDEFLNVPSSTVSELLKNDFNALAKGLQDYSSSIGKFSIKMKNPDELVKALTLFMAMKKSEKFLKKGAIQDPSKHFKDSNTVMRAIKRVGMRVVEKLNFEGAVDIMRQIMKKEGSSVDDDERNTLLVKLAAHISKLTTQLSETNNYKTLFKDYLGLVRLKTDLKDFTNVVSIAGEYSTTFQKIDPFRNDLKLASNDAPQTKSAILDIQKYSEIVQTISTTPILNSISTEGGKKKLTSGLSQYTDLNIVFKDLVDPWFQKHVARDGDTNTIIAGLEVLKTFLTKFASISLQWKSFSENSKSREQSLALIKTISEAYDSGKKALEISSTKSPFEEISTCISSMKPLAHPIDKPMFDSIVEYADLVHRNIRSFENGIEKINENNLAVTIRNTENLESLLFKVVKNMDANKTINVWDSIRSLGYLEDLAKNYESTISILSPMDESLFYDKGDELNYDVISGISTVFDGTNVDAVVGCIQKSSIDNLVEMFSFVRRTQDLKAQSLEFKTATSYITSASTLKTSVKNLIDETKTKKLTKEGQALKESKSFENILKISEGIGKGVYSLRSVENVLKSEKSVLAVADSDVSVKTAVAQIKDLEHSYDDKYRKNLKTSVGKVKEFEKKVKGKPHESITDLQKFFKDSNQMKAQNTMNTMFLKKIGNKLAENPDAKIQGVSEDFQSVGSLDLDFVKHLSSFGSASGQFAQLESSILGFLKAPKESQLEDDAVEEESSSLILIFAIVVFVALAAVAIILLCLFYCRPRGICLWRLDTVEISEDEFQKEMKNAKGKPKDVAHLPEEGRWVRKVPVFICRSSTHGLKNGPKSKSKKKSKSGKEKGEKSEPGFLAKLWLFLSCRGKKESKRKGNKGKKKKVAEKKEEKNEVMEKIRKEYAERRRREEKEEEEMRQRKKQEEEEKEKEKRKDSEKKKKLMEIQKDLAELRIHARKCAELQKIAADPKKFKHMGAIHMPRSPPIPPPAQLPNDVILDKVEFCEELNEQYDIGSDVDDVELESESIDSTDEEDEIERNKKTKSAEDRTKK